MSSVLNYLKRLVDQVNPLDHGKTAKNPTGLPLNVPLQTPGQDIQGPSYADRIYTRPEGMPTIQNNIQSRFKMVPVLDTNGTIMGQDRREVNWLGEEIKRPMLPPFLQNSTYRPIDMGNGDYERQTSQLYNANPDVQLPTYWGRNNQIRLRD